MGWLARRRRSPEVATADPAPATSTALVPRVERALVTLAVHAAQLDHRLDQIERRLDQAVETTDSLPSHADVLAVRVHSARVAAELARVTVELRAEIDKLATSPGRLHDDRVRTLAESVLDLSDRIDTMPADLPRTVRA